METHEHIEKCSTKNHLEDKGKVIENRISRSCEACSGLENEKRRVSETYIEEEDIGPVRDGAEKCVVGG